MGSEQYWEGVTFEEASSNVTKVGCARVCVSVYRVEVWACSVGGEGRGGEMRAELWRG